MTLQLQRNIEGLTSAVHHQQAQHEAATESQHRQLHAFNMALLEQAEELAALQVSSIEVAWYKQDSVADIKLAWQGRTWNTHTSSICDRIFELLTSYRYRDDKFSQHAQCWRCHHCHQDACDYTQRPHHGVIITSSIIIAIILSSTQYGPCGEQASSNVVFSMIVVMLRLLTLLSL